VPETGSGTADTCGADFDKQSMLLLVLPSHIADQTVGERETEKERERDTHAVLPPHCAFIHIFCLPSQFLQHTDRQPTVRARKRPFFHPAIQMLLGDSCDENLIKFN
jgi:hypothetical protein